MKRIYIVYVILGFIVLVSFIYLLNNQFYLKPYRINTSSSSPSLNVGDQVFISKLGEYKKFDFIAFENFDSFSGKEAAFISRLIAAEGDTLLIKNGEVFVNNKNIDKLIILRHTYFIPKSIVSFFKNTKVTDEVYHINDSVFIGNLIDGEAEKYNLKMKVSDSNSVNKNIQELYGLPWNQDNFGPLLIPKNKIFLIGDNRHNTMDSRFIGLIDVSKIIGKVILK